MPPPRRDLVGRTLGDFVVVARLDEGGHGVVYRAEQKALGREAVIKVMQARTKAVGAGVQRFLREARLASKLDHPYAAHVYAFGAEPDGLLWIAMELVRGTPLDRLLAESGPLPLERLVPFFERLCEVVHTAHEQGIIHRDLKPANVMVVSRAGRLLPKLLDLGIAKMTDAASAPPTDLTSTGEQHLSGELTAPLDAALTSDGMVVGSPLYMAPEQWTSPATVDARTDIYALAILVYEALTRRRPFTGSSVQAVARAHAEQIVPPLGDGFPPALDDALRRALAKRQEERPASALDLAVAIRSASGLEAEREALPRLDDETRAAALADLPRPIADAVAALDGARHGHQLRDIVREIVTVVCHTVGILALACRSRLARPPDSELVVALTRRGLSDGEWLTLARQLCRPYADEREIFPLPELVGFVLDGATELEALAAAERTGSFSEEQLRPILVEQLAALGRVLRALGFLADYPLAGAWMGAQRPTMVPPAEPLSLADGRGRPLLLLEPLIQPHPPTPGAPPELFYFAGRGRRGARFLAPPRGFERTDDAFWPWYREHLFASPDAEPPGAAEESPYRGLASFGRADAARFFGREAETEAFLNRLRVTPLLAVVGPSGAGKSSFVHAGVIPGLPDGLRVVTLRPGNAPLAALDAALRDVDGPALVVVDQAEELFTLCRDDEERRAFARRVVALARTPEEAGRVVLTLRDDFLIRATELEPFRERLGAGLQLLATPARADLLRILTLPAERAGYRFEEADLPARMVDDVAGRPGALALLSFTAARLWELRDRHFKQLPRKAYDAIGGVGGALAQHAEAIRAGLPAEEQRLLRESFRALVTAEGTRAVLSRRELVEVLGDTPAAARTLDKLVDARLLQTTETETGPTVEIIHETLLEAWPRLVEWRREDAEGARLRDQLRAAARQWDERARAPGLLWREDALAEHQRWRARYPGQLSAVENAFGDASVAEARRSRRNRRLALGAVVVGLSVALTVALVLRAQAVNATATTEANFTELLQDQGRRLLLQDDVLHAVPYLTSAYDRGGANPAVRYLLARAARMLDQQVAVLPHESGGVWEVLFSPDGRYVMSAGDDGRVNVWGRDGRRLLSFGEHRASMRTMAVSPDGTEALSYDARGRALQWDVATGRVLSELRAPPGGIAIAWSRDGTRVALGTRQGFLLLWDPVGRRPVAWLPAHPDLIRGLRFVGTSTRLISAGWEGKVVEWDGVTGRLVRTLHDGDSPIRSLVVSEDGRFVTFTTDGGTAAQLDLSTGGRRAIRGQTGRLWWAVSPPDGDLITTADDGSVLISEAGTPPRTRALIEHEGGVFHAALSADGERLVTGGQDGVTIVWSRTRERALTRLVGNGQVVRRVAIHPRGELVATAANDGPAVLWRPVAIDQVRETLLGVSGLPAVMALAPDDELLAVGTWEGRLTLHSVASSTTVASKTLPQNPRALAWSRDGTRLLVVLAEEAQLRAIPSLELLSTLRRTDLTAGEFSAKDAPLLGNQAGKVITWDGTSTVHAELQGGVTWIGPPTAMGNAMGTSEGRVALFDGAGEVRAEWEMTGTLGTALVDPARREIYAGGSRAIRRWSLDTNATASFDGHAGEVTGLALLEEGELLASASDDGTVRVWDRESGVLLATLPGPAGRVIGLAKARHAAWFLTIGTARLMSIWQAPAPADVASLRARLACAVPFELAGDTLVARDAEPCDPHAVPRDRLGDSRRGGTP